MIHIVKDKICFSLDEQLVQNIRLIAVKKKTNASKLVTEYLEKVVEDNKQYL